MRIFREAMAVAVRNSALFVAGLAVAVLQIGATVATELFSTALLGNASLDTSSSLGLVTRIPVVLGSLGLPSIAWVLVAPFPLAGLYVACRRCSAADGTPALGGDVRRTVRLMVVAGRRFYRELLAGTVAFHVSALLLAAGLALLLHALALVATTGLSLGAYASGLAETAPHPMILVVLSALLVSVALLASTLPLRFYDVLILFGEERPTRSWLTSARFARRRPVATISYGLAVAVLLGVPTLVDRVLFRTVATGGFDAGTWALAGVAALALGCVSWTLFGVYHVTFFERVVEPDVRREERRISRTSNRSLPTRLPRRVAFALVLVGTLAAGSVAVRVTDARPMEATEPSPIDASVPPDELLAEAAGDTARTNVHVERTTYEINSTTGEQTANVIWRFGIDRRERQFRLLFRGRSNETAPMETYGNNYFAEGTAAWGPPIRPSPSRFGAFSRAEGNWTVVAAPGYVMTASDVRLVGFPVEEANWTLISETDDTVVIGVDGRATNPSTVGFLGGDGAEVHLDSYVHVTISKDTGYVREIEERRNVTYYDSETGDVRHRTNQLEVTRFRGHGTYDVERPREVGTPSLLELLWDVAYY